MNADTTETELLSPPIYLRLSAFIGG